MYVSTCMYTYICQNPCVACHLPRQPRKKTEISPFKNNLMGCVSLSFSPEDIFLMSLGGSFHSVSGSLQWLGFVPKAWGYGTPSSRGRTLWLKKWRWSSGMRFQSGSLQFTLPETNIAPWLEDDHFLLGPGLCSGPNVKLREGIFNFFLQYRKKETLQTIRVDLQRMLAKDFLLGKS